MNCNCNCRCMEAFLAIVILVFSFWILELTWLTSKWIIVAAAVILLLHGLGHKCRDNGVHKIKAPRRARKVKKRAVKRRKR